MTGWCDLRMGFMRRLAALALVLALPLAAGAAEPDPRLAENPALARVADADPAEARSLLDEIERALRQPPRRVRGSPGLEAEDEALLSENPLLKRLHAHDPMAALGQLERIKDATKRGTGGGRG